MRFRIVVVGIAIVCASAAAAEEPTLKWGLGVRSCAKFAQDFKENPELWETLYYVWAEGYMTGSNIVRISSQGKNFDLNPYNRSEQWRRGSIREYCAANPLAPYSEAVANLVLELVEPSSK